MESSWKRHLSHNKRNISGGKKKLIKVQQLSKSYEANISLCKNYYQHQFSFLDAENYEKFLTNLQKKPDIFYRVNPIIPGYQIVTSQFNEFQKNLVHADTIVRKNSSEIIYESNKSNKLLEVIEISNSITILRVGIEQAMLKNEPKFSELNKFLQKCSECRLIFKENLEQMLIPLLLNMNSKDRILDLCAAPGSKASIILQQLFLAEKNEKQIQSEENLPKGVMIVNDAEKRRVQMLTQKIHQSGISNVIAVNHYGQYFPQILYNNGKKQKQLKFNKVLLDAPCSADGMIPTYPKKMQTWDLTDSYLRHPLQLALLMRGINILENDGLLLYCVASINPIQNQAVIASLFGKVETGSIQLINIHGNEHGLKGYPGLTSWDVCYSNNDLSNQQGPNLFQKKQMSLQKKPLSTQEKELTENIQSQLKILTSYEQVKLLNLTKIKQTMFPPEKLFMKEIEIKNTLRILPNQFGSGGYYIALIRKKSGFKWKINTKVEQNIKNLVENQKPEDTIQMKQEQEQQRFLDLKFLQENLPLCQYEIFKEFQDKQREGDEQYSDSETEKIQKVRIPHFFVNHKKIHQTKSHTFTQIPLEQFEAISKFYGLAPQIHQYLYVRQGKSSKRKVFLIGEGVKQFLKGTATELKEQKKLNQLKLMKLGIKVLEKSKECFAGNQCYYRLCQDGIRLMLPLLQKRKIKATLPYFRKILQIHSLIHQEIGDENLRKQLKSLSQGSFAVYIDEIYRGAHILDGIVGQNFKNSFHLMISKQDATSFNIRYLDAPEIKKTMKQY